MKSIFMGKVNKALIVFASVILLAGCGPSLKVKPLLQNNYGAYPTTYEAAYDSACVTDNSTGFKVNLKKGQVFGAVVVGGSKFTEGGWGPDINTKHSLPESSIGLMVASFNGFSNVDYYAIIYPNGKFVAKKHHIVMKAGNANVFRPGGCGSCMSFTCEVNKSKPLFKKR